MDDISWQMYLCTGEDPTGGGLGPDFDPETGEYIEDTGEKEQEFKPLKS